MSGLIQQNILFKKERRRQPVLSKSTWAPVPKGLDSGYEHMSGLSFGDVRVHYSSPNPARIGAYAAGRNAYPGPGQEKHLPHEADMQGNAALQKRRDGGQPRPQGSTWGDTLIQMCPGPGDARPSHDSEEELESFFSESDTDDHCNISTVRKNGRDKAIRHVSNDEGSVVGNAKSREELVDDARAIHDILGDKPFSGNTTVVCAVLAVKRGFLHVAMVNHALMTPKMREKAQEFGYTVIRGIQTHAEANMILYAHKHNKDARLIAFGCDKDTCPECAALLRECLTEDLEFPTRPLLADGTEDFSPKYHFRSTSTNPVGVGPFVARMQSVIDRDYEDGERRNTTSIEVIGCTKNSQGEVSYIVKEVSGEIRYVPSKLAREKYLKEIFEYLESRLIV